MTATAPSFITNNPGIADGVTLEKNVLSKFKAFIDGTFVAGEAEVPKLVGDEITFGEQWLQTHATGFNASIIGGALAIGGSILGNETNQLTAVAQATLISINKTIDLHLAVYGAV